MLTISSPDLVPYTANGVSMGTVGIGSQSVAIASLESGLNSLLLLIDTASVPAYTGNSFTLSIPDSPSLITQVQIANQYYSLTESLDSPNPGEFYYNPVSGELTVYPSESLSPGTEVSYTGLASDYGENVFGERIVPEDIVPEPYPQFLSNWQVEGQITLTRNFRGHPSATCRFNASMADEANIRSSLRKGKDENLFGVGLMISDLTIARKSLKKFPEGEIACEVQFTGKWDSAGNTERSPLDKPVKWKRLSSPKTSLSAIADKAGVPFSGESVEVKNRSDTPSGAYTTFRQELESRAIVAKGFPFYSSPHRVEMRRWAGTRVHYLSDAEVISEEVPVNLPGFGVVKDGVQVVKEVINVAFNPDSDGSDPASEGRIVLYEGNLDIEEPPRYTSSDGSTVRVKLSLRENQAFDSGGETKTLKKVTYENGTTLIEEEQTWGFVYAFTDVYSISFTGTQFVVRYDENNDLFLSRYWKKISESVRIYGFEEKTGYLNLISRTGYRLARFKSESASLESVEIQKELTAGLQSGLSQSEEARLRAMLATYTDFDKLPINDTTEYELEKLADYYSDIQEPSEEEEEGYVPPKFARRSIRTDTSYAVKPDPESTPDDERPPLSTGKKFTEVREVNVVFPRTNEKQVFPEIFRESEATSNQQGAFLENVLNISSYKENKGRPSVQQRFEKVEREPEPNTATAKSPGKYKTLFYSQGAVYENDIEQGSVSFPGVVEASKARELIEIQLQQDNVSSESLTIQVLYNPEYAEGDLLVWQGVTYVILGINITLLAQNREVTCDKFEVSLGRLLKLPVLSRKVFIPE